MRDDDAGGARDPAPNDGGLHRAVQAESRGPLHRGAHRRRPLGDRVVVADAPHGQRCRRGDDPFGHALRECGTRRLIEHAGQAELGQGEGLDRDQHRGRRGRGHVASVGTVAPVTSPGVQGRSRLR